MNTYHEHTFHSCFPEHTLKLGYIIGLQLIPTTVVMLTGDLGSGKTVFVKGLADGIGVPNAKYVNSPTYNLINKYVGRFDLYHVDLYRINNFSDLDDIGLIELFNTKSIIVVEWPEKIDINDLPDKYLNIYFKVDSSIKRSISIISNGFFLNKIESSPLNM